MPMRKIVILHSEVAPDAAEDELDCLRQAKTIAETVTALGDAPILLLQGPPGTGKSYSTAFALLAHDDRGVLLLSPHGTTSILCNANRADSTLRGCRAFAAGSYALCAHDCQGHRCRIAR